MITRSSYAWVLIPFKFVIFVSSGLIFFSKRIQSVGEQLHFHHKCVKSYFLLGPVVENEPHLIFQHPTRRPDRLKPAPVMYILNVYRAALRTFSM
jgi:hypothetical protein